MIDMILGLVDNHLIDEAFDVLTGAISELEASDASTLPDLTQTNADFFANVYGSKDILAQTGVGGYRDELMGFTPGNDLRELFNIQILGADHLDYMRRSITEFPFNPPDQWNDTVAAFVTDLLIASTSRDSLQQFLDEQTVKGIVSVDSRGVWIVKLPGWEQA